MTIFQKQNAHDFIRGVRAKGDAHSRPQFAFWRIFNRRNSTFRIRRSSLRTVDPTWYDYHTRTGTVRIPNRYCKSILSSPKLATAGLAASFHSFEKAMIFALKIINVSRSV
jgi:hypothetical protein